MRERTGASALRTDRRGQSQPFQPGAAETRLRRGYHRCSLQRRIGAAIAGLPGGHIDCTSLVWPAVSAQVRAGKFRVLAVTSPIGEFPELPTFAAKGFPQAGLEVFFAILGPAGLPREVKFESAWDRRG